MQYQHKETISRQQLYDLVWSTPLLTLAKKYLVSDNGLRKICKRMNIPLPKAGHWMKLSFGRKVTIKTLPVKFEGDNEIKLKLRGENNPPSPYNEINLRKQEIKLALGDKLIVPEKLHRPDKLIIEAKKQIAANGFFDPYTYKKVVGCGREVLDIRIGKQNLQRSLLFLDTLIKCFRLRGHQLFFKYDDTYIKIQNHEYKINFREKMSRVIVPATYGTKTELHPTGILCFRIDNYSGREWKDGKEPLENKIAEIIAKLELMSEEDTLQAKQRDEARKLREEEERVAKELKERKEKALLDFKVMLEKAERWHKAVNLRNYINELEALGTTSAEWLINAKQKADWYDPFLEIPDELFTEVDRTTLTFKKTSFSW